MGDLYYSVVGIIAIVIHSIINFDLVKDPDNQPYYAARDYSIYLASVFVYYITDVLWGIFDVYGSNNLLYADTILYYIAMASTVIFWCRYVIAYLSLNDRAAKILHAFGKTFWCLNIVTLIVNHFVPWVFSIEADGSYHAHYMRYATLFVQMMMFAAVACIAFYFVLHSSKDAKNRNLTMGIFSLSMIAIIMIQIAEPLFPTYSIGLLIGNCLIHEFVQDDQKEQFKNRMKENSDIIANAGFGIWRIILKDGEAPRMQVSTKMEELLALDASQISEEEVYSSWYDNIVPEAIPSVTASVQEMIEGKLSENTYMWNHPVDGIIYVRCGGVSRTLEDGTHILSGYHANVTDIVREEKKQAALLREAKQRAEAANAAKTTFLFNMSHDIRTPMNAIMGYTDLLEKYHTDPIKCQDYLGKIRASSDFLLSLINNVLEMARIESGKVGLDEKPVRVGNMFAEITAVYDEQMKKKNIRFHLESDVTAEYVYCDSVKINEIFLNLVSNAYKYTAEGGVVTVALRQLPHEKKGYIYIQSVVADTGIGMSKEYLPNLFEEFTREHSTTDINVQGTGLGMAIVKRLVELMSGTITVESDLGIGTTFTITIPHKVAEAPWVRQMEELEQQEKRLEDFFGRRILLAEDNDLNAEIAMEILADEGFLVERATNGAVCCEMLEKESESYYDIILMDIQMPIMDGYEATRKIRAMDDRVKRNIPIVAMTANAFSEDKANAYAAGMNAHLAKPININDLLEVLAIYIKK